MSDTRNVIRIDDARSRRLLPVATAQRSVFKRKRPDYANQHTGAQCIKVLTVTKSLRKAASYHPDGESGLANVLIEAIFGGKQAA